MAVVPMFEYTPGLMMGKLLLDLEAVIFENN